MKTSALQAILLLSIYFNCPGQQPVEIPPTGGGEFSTPPTICVSPEKRAAIHASIHENRRILLENGLLQGGGERVVGFDWPIANASGLGWNSAYATNNYVDEDPTGGIEDYNCGSRTYNGHNGTDIDTWPFPGYLQANDLVEVVAGEPGTIVDKDDGFDDDHCSCVNGDWNAIFIEHADGSIAWYGHMKKNSLTSKTIGQTVVAGEYLGIVASSGCSTQPHLHFEVWETPYTELADPWWVSGGCNDYNTTTWWAAQKPYREKTLNVNLTHSAPPIHGCPIANETPNFKNAFASGQTAYFATYYHDQTAGDVTTMSIVKPDGSNWAGPWTHTSPGTYTKSWWYWGPYTLPTSGSLGTWKWRVVYDGNTYEHSFTLATALPIELSRFEAKLQPGHVLLQWETLSENGLAGFEVQRAMGGTDWATIGEVKALGADDLPNGYSFRDQSPPFGVLRYRLLQKDLDGGQTHSSVATVANIDRSTTVVLAPNPVSDLVGCFVQTGFSSQAPYGIYNQTGQLVKTGTVQAEPTGVWNPIDIHDLKAGMYYLEVLVNDEQFRKKLVVR